MGCTFHPWTGGDGCGCFLPPATGLKRHGMAPEGEGRKAPATTPSGVDLTSRRLFAGMPGAQATARQRRRDRSGRCKPGVFTHRTVAAARNRASGFGGDWRVRQQPPVGVGPDDRMPPGSREPKGRMCKKVL
ncbi:TPA: hypothetical protein RXG71_005488 [Escherichia coli]|nr:hypothetical protein [Escherichia coli]